MVRVCCEMKDCIYYVKLPKRQVGIAYQNQCGTDEIEIGEGDWGIPKCYTYEKKEKKNATNRKS